jgi:hypothetical protein
MAALGSADLVIHSPGDMALMHAMLTMFGEAGERASGQRKCARPSPAARIFETLV